MLKGHLPRVIHDQVYSYATIYKATWPASEFRCQLWSRFQIVFSQARWVTKRQSSRVLLPRISKGDVSKFAPHLASRLIA